MDWISVKDKPPKVYEEYVLVFTSKGAIGLGLLEDIGEIKWHFIPATGVGTGEVEMWWFPHTLHGNRRDIPYINKFDGDEIVTHWMPLPGAPFKEDKK